MEEATHQRIMTEMGLGTEEDRLRAQMRTPGLAIALLTVLKQGGYLDEEEIEQIHTLAESVAEKLTTFSLAALKLGLASEGLASLSPAEAKDLMQTVLGSGRWLLESSLAMGREKKLELREMLDMVERELKDGTEEEP